MSKAIRIHAHGGPEVLTYEDVDAGRPGRGQVLVRHTAIGLNFLDVYYRTGLYAAPDGLPLIPGAEAAGVVVEVGEGVEWPKPGDRVAYVDRARRLCGGAADRRRPAGGTSRRRVRRAGGGLHAEGADGGISAASHLCGEAGRHDPLSRGRRRRRPDRRPVGETSRRHGDRQRRVRRRRSRSPRRMATTT